MTRTEHALRPEELALLIDSIEDYAIFQLAPDGEIRSWNAGAARTMGYTADEIIGENFSRFYEPEDLASKKPQRELEVASREGRIEDEGWRVRKDGTRFWANTIITALHDPQSGKLTGFAKVTRDLTKRREAEERVRESEEMFRLLIESVRDYAIFMLDPGGHVMSWNVGAQRIKGYTPEEIIGQHFSRFYTEEDKRNDKPAHVLEIARKYGSIEDEGWRVRKDGTRFWANVVLTAVYDRHGELRGYTKVTRDMTERKRAEEMSRALFEQREARYLAEEERRRAEDSYRVAQEANRAKDEFLMTLSHELRTPMTAILGWARLLPTFPPGDEGFKEAVAAIVRSAQLQARLIDDVLDVSRIVSGKLRLAVENFDLLKLLTSATDAVRPSAEAKSITLSTAFADHLGTVSADATRVQQIVWNLLTNAVKFTPKGGRIEVSARRTASHVQISVTDSGEGVDPQFLPHVFEPFRQAESPSTRVHGGLGLGLSIVRYLAEAHGGTVSAESQGRGKGATFTLTLPVRAASVERKPVKVETPEPHEEILSMRRLDGMSVLLVDDDNEARALFRTLLRQAGATVTVVDSATSALEQLGELRPDLVLTDIAMPHTNGYALAREIRQHWPRQKVVAVSAFPAGRSGSQDSVFDEYITKPVEPAEFIDKVAKVLAV